MDQIVGRLLRRSLLVLLLALAGCGGSAEPDPPTTKQSEEGTDQPEASQIGRTEIERGPVKVTVEVEPQPARLSDEPTLTLTIDYEQEVLVDKPPFGEAIGDFIIRDFHETLPETKNNRDTIRHVYTLEPTRSGTLQIAPIAVTFVDNRPSGDGEKHTIETESVAVEIASVLESEAPSLDDLQGLTGPVPLPAGRSYRAWFLVGILSLAGIVFLAIWLARGRRGTVEEQRLTPRELAYLELQELVEDNLGETDVKLFYVRLTGIVRRYIERTTQIHAPEQTTEEFLREINSRDVFQRDDQQRLKSFLESADFVKFAAHQPTANDVEQAFDRAKAFVGLENGRPVPVETGLEAAFEAGGIGSRRTGIEPEETQQMTNDETSNYE